MLVCVNEECTIEKVVADSDIAAPVPVVGTTYRVNLQWEDATNLFTITFPGYAPVRINPTDSVAGNAKTDIKAIGTRVSNLSNADSGGYIFAKFDNVDANGVIYDDFNSLPPNMEIDNSKWADFEFMRWRDTSAPLRPRRAAQCLSLHGIRIPSRPTRAALTSSGTRRPQHHRQCSDQP